MSQETTQKSGKPASGRKKAERSPELTKAKILNAARIEFSERGLSGARVNKIAEQAGVNKQLLYYYFTDKDRLYQEVLEQAYGEIRRREELLKVDDLPAIEALETLVRFNFDYIVENRYFVSLLNDENLHQARHIESSAEITDLYANLNTTLSKILDRGLKDGSFSRAIDPIELYVTIASLCYFFLSNRFTLSAIFSMDLSTPERIAARRDHVVDLILGHLCVNPKT